MKNDALPMKILLKSCALALLCALGAIGCDAEESQTAPEGELGQGNFEYRCALPSDSYCSTTNAIDSFKLTRDFGGNATLPEAVAVGALFELRYLGPENVSHLSAASEQDEAGSGIFSVNAPAIAAFLAWDKDEDVIDFTLLDARPVAQLLVWQNQLEADVVELEEDSHLELTVTALDKNGILLAGALPYEWLSQDTDVVKLDSLKGSAPARQLRNLSDIQLVPQAPGVTTVTVNSGSFKSEIEVIVR